MAGHSKWANIKHKKEAMDAKRGQLFTKLSRLISVAAKEGGSPDPAVNYRLRLAVDQAKQANMPMDKIKKAIDRVFGRGKKGLENVELELFGPGGVGIIVMALTDNKQRLIGEVRNVLKKYGGSMGQSGAVVYRFKKCVIVRLEGDINEEWLLGLSEVGVFDFKIKEKNIWLYVEPDKVNQLRERLKGKGVKEEKLGYVVEQPSQVDEEGRLKISRLVEALEALDEVYQVFVSIK